MSTHWRIVTEQLTAAPPWTTRVVTGAAAGARIRELADHLDAASEAYCTTAAWLTAAATHLPGEPVVLTVGSADGPVAGVAALSRTRRRGIWRIELLGGELNDYGRLHHDDAAAGAALADALAAWVVTEHAAWSLDLAQLPADDPVVAGLLARLPRARLEPGAPIPQIRGIGTDYRVSRNRRRKANNALNRIAADGRRAEQLVVRDRAELERWLPVVTDVRRRRDHACGRRSHLDDPAVRAFHEAFVRDLCAAGALTLDLLLVDDAVAGYGMVVEERGVHRVFDGRVADGLEHYRGALVCDLAATARAEADPSVTTFDWLRGRTDGKFGNHEERRVGLVATSGPAVARLDRWERAARDRVKAALPGAALRRIAAR
ncbi:GNAT family N-acetyltransferase [Nocardioides nitrophenolicus]|uniref:GNAT family N-acetyltransferase n=1 Tax=Nocardioides nitrophenolicus TaxID=60489 RepID=UPI00195D229E|nr:GNAT family N-acetyltransferase [Nocardioides nitrophenolicus]MBM7520319.1 CelD/BcsL family acetyltransferase involved in cellulose biosynthesis [Nocardioides nitrophenolicus]